MGAQTTPAPWTVTARGTSAYAHASEPAIFVTALGRPIAERRANARLAAAAPDLLAALNIAIAIVREERDSFVECQTAGAAGDLATIDAEARPFLDQYDAAIAVAERAIAKARGSAHG